VASHTRPAHSAYMRLSFIILSLLATLAGAARGRRRAAAQVTRAIDYPFHVDSPAVTPMRAMASQSSLKPITHLPVHKK
jgi:hypothetical protein